MEPIDPSPILQWDQLLLDDESIISGIGGGGEASSSFPPSETTSSEPGAIKHEILENGPGSPLLNCDEPKPKKPKPDDKDLISIVEAESSKAKLTDSKEEAVFQVESLLEAQALIERESRSMGVFYRKHKVPKNFGNTDWRSICGRKKLFLDESGQPFIKPAQDSCVYECHQGPDHDAARKASRKGQNVSVALVLIM